MTKHISYKIDKLHLGDYSTLANLTESRYTMMEKYDLTIHCLQWIRGVHDRKI